MKIIGKHHVRANFYHLVSLVFLATMSLWYFDIISDHVATIVSFVLFITDYIAEMYDPHPDSPGPWFKSHFHRALDNSESDECPTDKFFYGCDKKLEKAYNDHIRTER